MFRDDEVNKKTIFTAAILTRNCPKKQVPLIIFMRVKFHLLWSCLSIEPAGMSKSKLSHSVLLMFYTALFFFWNPARSFPPCLLARCYVRACDSALWSFVVPYSHTRTTAYKRQFEQMHLMYYSPQHITLWTSKHKYVLITLQKNKLKWLFQAL